MINIIPIQGPNGAVSAATTTLLGKTILKHDDPEAANILTKTLLTPLSSKADSVNSDLSADISDLLLRISSNTRSIESNRGSIGDLWIKLNSKPWMADINASTFNIDFDSRYIIQNTSGEWYSRYSDGVYADKAYDGQALLSVYRQHPSSLTDGKYIDSKHFDRDSHGHLVSTLSNGEVLHDLATNTKPGFMAAADKALLDTYSIFFGQTNESISNKIKSQLSGLVYPGALNNGSAESGKLSSIGTFSSSYKSTYSKYDDWLKIAQAISRLEEKAAVTGNFLEKGTNTALPQGIKKYVLTPSGNKLYVKQQGDGKYWLFDNYSETVNKSNTQYVVNTDYLISNGRVYYKKATINKSDFAPGGWAIPTNADWLALNTSLGSVAETRSINYFDGNYYSQISFNGLRSGYLTTTGSITNDDSSYLWSITNNSYEVADYTDSGIMISDASIADAYLPVRFIITDTSKILDEPASAPAIDNIDQVVNNTVLFNNYTQYFSPRLQNKGWGNPDYTNVKWDVTARGELGEAEDRITKNEEDIALLFQGSGHYLGQFDHAKSQSNPLSSIDVNAIDPPVRPGDWALVADDELNNDHRTKWIYTESQGTISANEWISAPVTGTTPPANDYPNGGFAYGYIMEFDMATNSAPGVIQGEPDTSSTSTSTEGYITVDIKQPADNNRLRVIGYDKYGVYTTPNTQYVIAQSNMIKPNKGNVVLHDIARTGKYSNIIDKPTIDTNSVNGLTPATEVIEGGISLHRIAKTGSRADLRDVKTLTFGPSSNITNAYTGLYDGSSDITISIAKPYKFDNSAYEALLTTYGYSDQGGVISTLHADNTHDGVKNPVRIVFPTFRPRIATYTDFFMELPVATTDVQGTVRIGADIQIDSNGKISTKYTAGSNISIGSNYVIDNTYSLPLATASSRGGVMLSDDTRQTAGMNSLSSTAGRTYGIQLYTGTERMVVNVPWTDTHWSSFINTINADNSIILTHHENNVQTSGISFVRGGDISLVGSGSRVIKISSPSYTASDGIVRTNDNFSHSSYTPYSSGLYKVTVDSLGHISSATAVTKSDITGLGIPAQDTNSSYSLVWTNSETSTTQTASTNANTFLNLVKDGSVLDSNNIIGVSGIEIETNGTRPGVIELLAKPATYNNFGVVQLGSDTVQTVAANAPQTGFGRTYPIQFNSSNQLVVNVPWVNTDTDTWPGTSYTTNGKNYAVKLDTNSNMYVNVPWTDTTYTVNNATLTIKQNGTSKGTFTANSSTNVEIDLTDTDTNTTYSAGAGLTLSGTTFSNNFKWWTGSKASYDAISSKDSGTIYFVTP